VSGGCVIAGYVRFSASCGTSGIGMEVNGLSGSEVPSAGGDVLSLSGSALLSLESVAQPDRKVSTSYLSITHTLAGTEHSGTDVDIVGPGRTSYPWVN